MKKIICGILMTLCVFTAQASNCVDNYYGQIEPVHDMAGMQELCMQGFVVMYSTQKNTAVWSAQKSTKQDVVDSGVIPRITSFHVESQLANTNHATNADYLGTLWDKGHLTPFKNMAFSKDINSLANVVPQAPSLNRGKWKQLETAVRSQAIDHEVIYVITGAVFPSEQIQYIGNAIPVPSHVFKIVIFPQDQHVDVWLAENTNIAQVKKTTLQEVEQMTGIIFMPATQLP